MMSTTYLSVTTMKSAQTISESAPSVSSCRGNVPPVARTRADVAEHHAQRSQHQHPVAAAAAGGNCVRGADALRVVFQRIGQTRSAFAHAILGGWFIHRTRRSWRRERAGFQRLDLRMRDTCAPFKGADHTPTRPKGNRARQHGARVSLSH
jgi:hypothetical protein